MKRFKIIKCISFLIFSIFNFIIAIPAQEQGPKTIRLVKDLNQSAEDSDIFNTLVLGEELFFFTPETLVEGRELWISDGTLAGTRLFKDIIPGAGDIGLYQPFLLENEYFFFANLFPINNVLYKADLEKRDTTVVKVLNSNRPVTFIYRTDKLAWFEVKEPGVGHNLWRTDGTPQGTYIIKSFPLTSGDQVIDYSQFYNDSLYFSVEINDQFEIWSTNGTVEGTNLFTSMASTLRFGNRFTFNFVNNQMIFAQRDANGLYNLGIFNSETGEIILIENLPFRNILLNQAKLADNQLFFFASSTNFVEYNLWTTDGSTEGTFRLSDAILTPQNLSLSIAGEKEYFFVAKENDPLTSNYNLWTTDGTKEGTSNLSSLQRQSVKEILMVHEDLIYLSIEEDRLGSELWAYEINTRASKLLKDLNPGIGSSQVTDFTVYKDKLFFTAFNELIGRQLYSTDGTTIGTQIVKKLQGPFGGYAGQLFVFNEYLFFVGVDPIMGFELWRSSGTAETTQLFKDIYKNPGNTNLVLLESGFDAPLFFITQPQSNIDESGLWVTDGKPESTLFLQSLKSGYDLNSQIKVPRIGETTFFMANQDATGTELWRTSGTPESTFLVKDINPGRGGSGGIQLFGAGDKIFFTPEINGKSENSLWVSDGSEEGTFRIKEFDTGGKIGPPPSELTRVGKQVYFVTYEQMGGNQIWKTDGTELGTIKLEDYKGGAFPPYAFTLLDGEIYFFSTEEESGLYKLDPETDKINLIRPFSLSANKRMQMLAMGEELYFTMETSEFGEELWKSDGTFEGTQLFKDFIPGPASGNPFLYTQDDSNLYFQAREEMSSDYYLWRTDGTEIGTVVVDDEYSFRRGVLHNGFYYYSRFNENIGEELYEIPNTDTMPLLVEDLFLGASTARPLALTSHSTGLYFSADGGEVGRELYVLQPCDLEFDYPVDSVKTCGATIVLPKMNDRSSYDYAFLDLEGSSVEVEELETTLLLSANQSVRFNLIMGKTEPGCSIQTDTIHIAFLNAEAIYCEPLVSNIPVKEGSPFQFKIFPNPFKEQLQIELTLPERQYLEIQLFSLSGQYLKTILPDQLLAQGKHRFSMNDGSLKPGVYFVVVQSSFSRATKKIIKTE